MNGSDKLDQIAPAMVAALGKMKNPKTDSRADTGKFSYAYLSLPALCEHVRLAFDKVGLVFSQEVTDAPGGVAVFTTIMHLSGQYLELGPCVMPGNGSAQERGSAITYARRYALAAAVGLAADEDDDGAKASRRAEGTTRQASAAGTGAKESPPTSVPAPQSPDEVGTASGESSATESKAEGEAAKLSVAATPEQRTRLLSVYKKPSLAKEAACRLFGYEKPADVLITDLTSAEVEALILEAAS